MYRIKEIKFLDSVQYQIYESNHLKKKKDSYILPEELEEDSSYIKGFLVKKKQGKVFMQNPFNNDQWEYLEEIKEFDEKKYSESVRSSMSRTIKKIYDIGRSNMWDWFFTLTFNPDKVNSYDYMDCTKKLSKWLNNLRRSCPHMKYLVVPEQHKSGRWHFHGLFSCVENLDFSFSGRLTSTGKHIFNVGQYSLGFSTAIKLDGDFAIVGYMTKYITKSLCEVTQGKKRYENLISKFDLSEARIITKQGYIDVTYIDCFEPIYSTNTCFSNRLNYITQKRDSLESLKFSMFTQLCTSFSAFPFSFL